MDILLNIIATTTVLFVLYKLHRFQFEEAEQELKKKKKKLTYISFREQVKNNTYDFEYMYYSSRDDLILLEVCSYEDRGHAEARVRNMLDEVKAMKQINDCRRVPLYMQVKSKNREKVWEF